MLSIKTKEKLDWVLEQATEIEAATARLNKRLEKLTESISFDVDSENKGKERGKGGKLLTI